MKKFLLLSLLSISFLAFSQNPLLFNKVWYLSSLDFLGNNHYNSPDPNGGYTTFSQNGTFQTSYIDAGQATLTFQDNNEFILPSLMILDGSWNDPNIIQFNNAYFYGFLSGNNILYSYEISDNGKKLTITKYNGDVATYFDSVMATAEIDNAKYKIYPNPVSDILTIENLKPNSDLELIDSSGKMLRKISNGKPAKTEINIRNLLPGIYYLRINGQSTQKIVKK